MPKKHTMAAHLLRYALILGVQAGLSEEELCEAAQINPTHLADLTAPVPYEIYRNLLTEVARRTGNECFWLQKLNTKVVSLENPSFYWYYNAPNLREAGRRFERLYIIISSIAYPANVVVNEEFCIRLTPRTTDIGLSKYHVDLMLSAWWSSATLFAGPAAQLKCVRLISGDENRKAAYEKFFGAPTLGNQPFNELVFDQKVIDLPNVREDIDPNLDSVLEKMIQPMLVAATTKLPIKESCFQAIQRLLHHGAPKVEDVAESLGLSTRTFQRKMAQTDLSFSDMIQETRRELAVQYLKQSEISVTDISYMLGYSEVGSFTTAFRKWHQITPSEYRRLNHP